MSFANKVILVTGASSGIGAAIAVAFIREGANVAIVGRNEAKLNNVADQCKKNGGQPLVLKADITIKDQVEDLVKKTIDKFGKLDILVNNAGLGRFGSILEGTVLEAYDVVMLTNVRAQIHMTTVAAKYLIETKGNIINISSVAGVRVLPLPSFSAYCISKAALNHFTRCAAVELAPKGIRVNAVSPGPVRTEFMVNTGSSFSLDSAKTPLGRISESEDIADVVLFLAGDKAKSITGSIYTVDNGVLLV